MRIKRLHLDEWENEMDGDREWLMLVMMRMGTYRLMKDLRSARVWGSVGKKARCECFCKTKMVK